MCIIIDKPAKVRLGTCIRVLDMQTVKTNEQADAIPYFYCIQIEDSTGVEDGEHPILLTPAEYRNLKRVSISFDYKMKYGRTYSKFVNGENCFYIKLRLPNSDESFVVSLSYSDIRDFYARALYYKDSCTVKNFWVNLFD